MNKFILVWKGTEALGFGVCFQKQHITVSLKAPWIQRCHAAFTAHHRLLWILSKQGSIILLSFHTVLWSPTDNSSAVLAMSAGQTSGQALCDIYVSVCVCARSGEHICYPQSAQVHNAVAPTCVLAGRIHYIFLGGLGFTWPLHGFPSYVLELQGHHSVISGRCHMSAGPHRESTQPKPPVLVWTLPRQSSLSGGHSQRIRGLQHPRWIIYLKWTHKDPFCASCRLNLVAGNE